jgi:hypothetical protein
MNNRMFPGAGKSRRLDSWSQLERLCIERWEYYFFVIDSEYIFVGSAEEWLLKVTMVPT